MKAPLLLVSLFTATDALPGKVGLITEWTQQQKGTSSNGSTTAETYAYSYDKAGRLTGSLRYVGNSNTGVNTLTERNITYDRSGNLLTLDRYGDSSGTTPTESLSYTYTGPKRNTWTYDAHGNVTADPQAGLSIEWNAIGLPRTITASTGTGTASTQRFYLADGSLAQVSDGTSTRLYLGDMVFEKAADGTVTLESAGWEGGRLLPGTGADKVLYVIKDHLGSVRVVKDGTGAIMQRFDYYPYGTVSRTWTSSATTDDSEKRYRFGGKEVAGSALTDLAGEGSAPEAPYLDFGARLYSPRKAMWLSADPLMEKYYGIGANVYCAGNPVNRIDSDGCADFIVNGKVIGNDGVDDGRVLAIRTEMLSTKEQNKTIKFIKNYSGNTRAFQDNGFAYTNSIAIEPSADNRNAMVEEVSKDNGKGGPSDNNNREYGGSIKDGKVVVEAPGPVANPKTDSNAHIALPVGRSTFHSHPSGYIIERENTSSNNLSSSSTVGGISETTYAFKPDPSPEDKHNAGTYTCYVFARGNGQVYVYNSEGVQAIIPMKYFVNFKR